MKKLLVILAALAAVSGCTLLLPTEELIVPCVVDQDCIDAGLEEGFECLDNACLPIDEEVVE
jgi:hypothetical protein